MKLAVIAFLLGLAMEVMGIVASVGTSLGVVLVLGAPLLFWVVMPGISYLKERNTALLGPMVSGAGFYVVLLSTALPHSLVYPVAGVGWTLVAGGPILFWAILPLGRLMRDRRRTRQARTPGHQ